MSQRVNVMQKQDSAGGVCAEHTGKIIVIINVRYEILMPGSFSVRTGSIYVLLLLITRCARSQNYVYISIGIGAE